MEFNNKSFKVLISLFRLVFYSPKNLLQAACSFFDSSLKFWNGFHLGLHYFQRKTFFCVFHRVVESQIVCYILHISMPFFLLRIN